MKFSEAIEQNKEAIEALNDQARAELEADMAAKLEAQHEQDIQAAAKQEQADDQLFEAMRRGREKRKQEVLHSQDPDVFVRVLGNQASAVRVDVKPIIDDDTPSITLDFLLGALCALGVLGVVAYILAKALGVL